MVWALYATGWANIAIGGTPNAIVGFGCILLACVIQVWPKRREKK